MIHLYDHTTVTHFLASDIDPELKRLLSIRLEALASPPFDLTGDTEFVIIEPGDTEDDIVRCVGFNPLVEPIEDIRFGNQGFHPFWDWLQRHDGWYEMIVTFGSTFAYVLLIADVPNLLPDLLLLCRALS